MLVYLSFDSYIENIKKMTKKKTYMMKHIPSKQVGLKEIIILIKDVQKWVDQKMLTNVMNFFIFIVY